MPVSPAPTSAARARSILGVSPRGWLYVAIAFALGIALFLLIWSRQRNADDFYRPDTAHTGTSGQRFDPLPQPETGEANGSGIDLGPPQARPEDDGDTGARIVETAPAPPPPRPVAPATQNPQATVGSGSDSGPVPVSSPAPVYPRAALRRGESGTVLLRVQVGADGTPGDVTLVHGSGSRYLDRAATDAVRRWRFRPAMRGGQPVSGQVQVPISFQPGR